jgi:anti-anti-sigma regulatory factor
MGRDWSDDLLIVKLPAEPQTGDELNAVAAMVQARPEADLIVDLGAVDEPGCRSLCELMRLYRLVSDRGHRCMFCNVGTAARRILNVYGFDRVLDIAAGSQVVLKPSVEQISGGILELRSPDGSKPLQRRNYVRLSVPAPLEINVLLWHGGRKDDYHKSLPGHFWCGRLVDISEGGAQVAIDAARQTPLGRGRLIGLEFTPKPSEALLSFDAQIREILPTADGRNICLGLQFVGLEANPQGRQGLARLCSYEGIYYAAKEHAALFTMDG